MNGKTLRRMAKDVFLHGRAHLREWAGAESRYCIRGAYRHREEGAYFDDTVFRDEYQREVYIRASEIADREQVRRVYDVGCGSGYKLVTYLGQYETIGFDVPGTLEYLCRTYPDRQWVHATFAERSFPPADLVVCSDVIEHVAEPNDLMAFLVALSSRYIVLSTPDRRREYARFSSFQLGPPHTDHHVREWDYDEFARYVSRFVRIEEHCHPHPTHSTQMIVATVIGGAIR